ncbi:hypothetical protein DAPPUDRAFT_311900 [Daphnia pulex]|uniref:Apolipoprotein D n=1 Tax=Daphnia pulex TaxID=6669 RepID=E9FY95_DAPPU|nr:hypothetical protein DAPPUDRAFT_311900 [Daphnia pulex]|eukprot:EFX87815.1 hypothetical protein DAPPUDRAFT_311900 [Daphnia pulex]
MAGCFRTIVHAQVIALSSCPNVSVVSDFEVDQYLGKWYGNRNYFTIFQSGLDCVTAEYTLDGTEIVVKNEGIQQVTRRRRTANGKARLIEPGKLSVSFTDRLSETDIPNYFVLATDYTTYAVVWNCFDLGPISSRILWVLTREQHPSISTIDKAYAALKRNGIDGSSLRLTNQDNCTRR